MTTNSMTRTASDHFVSGSKYKDKGVPLEESGISHIMSEQDIFKNRTSNEDYVQSLLRKLAGKTIVKNKATNEWVVKSVPGVTPLMSYEGAIEVITYLSMMLNSSIVLSKIDEATARIEHDEIMESIDDLFTTNAQHYGLSNTKRYVVASLISTFVWHQLSRAVGGHEAKNLITTIQEQHAEQDIRESSSAPKKSFWSPNGHGWNK